jgi:hypothetical protein
MPDVFMIVHRVTTILAAARNNVPAVYDLSAFARDGGLLSYSVAGTDLLWPAEDVITVLRETRKNNINQIESY